MASIEHDRRRIGSAILFYGPPGSGKMTALYALARQLPNGTHGKVGPLHQGDNRLLRLDFRPHDQEMVYGYQVNFRLVACPGSIEVELLRPLLGAIDAVMFVADSSKSALKANVKALELLERLMLTAGRQLSDLPMVFLYNKRDLREAVEIRVLEEQLNRFGCNYIAASAVRGQGVLDGLQRLTASVAVQVRHRVQASGAPTGHSPGSAKTVAHGTSYDDARAIHGSSPEDDITAVSPDGQEAPSHWNVPGDQQPTHGAVSSGRSVWDDVAQPDDHTAPPQPEPARRAVPTHSSPAVGRSVWDDVAQPDDRTAPPQVAQGAGSQDWASEQDLGSGTASGLGTFSQLTPLEPPEPDVESWRTPSQFAESVEAEDHTMPYRNRAAFGDQQVGTDDVTQTQVGGYGGFDSQVDSGYATAQQTVRHQTPAAQPAPTVASVERAAARSMQAPQGYASGTPMMMEGSGVAQAHAGGDAFSTQAINSMARNPESWEQGLDRGAQRMKVPVAQLAGYVVSRIGTPKASSRRTVQVPIRATHMDTLMPQDFVVELEFRSSSGVRSTPVVSARRLPESQRQTVPLSWLVSVFGISLVAIVVIIAVFMSRIG